MSQSQLKNVNFGRLKLNATGSAGVGYQLLDQTGSIAVARTTSGVYQTAPGIYSAYVAFADNFVGQILWDTGSYFLTASHASEDYKDASKIDSIYDVVTSMTGTLKSIYDIQYGRWRIVNNKMQFFKEDNSTLIIEFNLLDDAGNPTMDSVFERTRI